MSGEELAVPTIQEAQAVLGPVRTLWGETYIPPVDNRSSSPRLPAHSLVFVVPQLACLKACKSQKDLSKKF
jgi:hypothetical protein